MPLHISILLISFFLTLISGALLIPMLTRLKFGQVVRDDGPQTHLKKMGTPTIGGIIFLIPLTIICGYFSLKYPQITPVLLATLIFGAIGFIDDYLKVVLKRSKGLSARQKMLGLLVVSTGFAFYLQNIAHIGSEISIPFTNTWLDFGKNITIPFLSNALDGKTAIGLNLSWAYVPFIVFVLLSTTNSVNLTDGLDGLASGICLIMSVFFTLVAMAMENTEMIIFSSALAGVCTGFLAFNMNPARIFMGDTGSLALGGAIGCIGIVMKMPLVIIIIAGVCVTEAVSVIIQVLMFKMTGKRVFKMAPIHHHFELMGWSEKRVVRTFWAATIVLCFIGLLSLRYTVF